MKITLFGSFYPRLDRLATATTGLALLFERIPHVESVTVFAPQGCRPPASTLGKIQVIESWEYDDIPSLLRTAGRMNSRSLKSDVYVFNLILTSFGRSRSSNLVGFVVPLIVSLRSRGRVCVYLHNTIEAQNTAKLGYQVSRMELAGVRLVERALLYLTHLIVPLPSQAELLPRKRNRQVAHLVIPYLEAMPGVLLNVGGDQIRNELATKEILFFGSLGPQKDLNTVVRAVCKLVESGADILLRVAGSINPNFPSEAEEALNLLSQLPKRNCLLQLKVDESQVPGLFRRADLLVLPYNAAGGYSGVMNIADFFALPIVAYDVPELREFSRLVSSAILFVPAGDVDSMVSAISTILKREGPRDYSHGSNAKVDVAIASAAELVAMATS